MSDDKQQPKDTIGMKDGFSEPEKDELKKFVRNGLLHRRYSENVVDGISDCVVAHCNDKQLLKSIHNDLQKQYTNYKEVYEDVKNILKIFVSKNKSDN